MRYKIHGKIPGRYKTILIVAAVLIAQVMSPDVHAHKVYLFAWSEGDTIYTESYFSRNSRVKDGEITVYDLAGVQLLKGRSDSNGEFSFKIPQRTDLRIVLDSSLGHRAEYIFNIQENIAAPQGPEQDTPVDEAVSLSDTATIDMAQIRQVVEEAIDSRLAPITKELLEKKKDQDPGLKEIISGIGYILGIMGIVLYIRGRKKD